MKNLPDGVELREEAERQMIYDLPVDVMTTVVIEGKERRGFLDDFNADELNLGEEAAMQGQKLLYYGDIFAAAKMALTTAEENAKVVWSTLYLKYKMGEQVNGKPPTEEHTKCLIIVDPAYREAIGHETFARREAQRAEIWWRAIQKKSDHVNMLGYLKGAELKKGY
jgi:hypothetical protein